MRTETETTTQIKAAIVGAQAADVDAARQEAIGAEAELLEHVVRILGPVTLKALSSRIVAERFGDTVAADRDHFQAQKTTYHEARGLLIYDGVNHTYSGTGTKHYQGYELYLTAGGDWLECCRERDTTIWQGARDHEQAMQWRTLSAQDVAEEYDVDELLHELNAALDRQANGKAPERAQKFRARAQCIGAINALLTR
jgi:hypothetical protein